MYLGVKKDDQGFDGLQLGLLRLRAKCLKLEALGCSCRTQATCLKRCTSPGVPGSRVRWHGRSAGHYEKLPAVPPITGDIRTGGDSLEW